LVPYTTLFRSGASFPRNTMNLGQNFMKTYSANEQSVKRDWYVVDADGKTLGRLASELATRLRGKHKPVYTPHADTGDYIVVINAEKVKVTGNKAKHKMYYRHTGFPGGIKEANVEKLIARRPELGPETAVNDRKSVL